jgi:NAD(P)-dependent dehydrogenase (short-subunit alcohol dehydrogenase family)
VDRLAADGATVATCGRNEPDDLPEGVAFFAADVREADQADALVEAVVARFGRLDLLVNNAGGAPYVEAATASPRLTASTLALNLSGPFFVGQAANRVMQDQDDGGVIVNIGSVSALRPSPGAAVYGAAKAGLWNLTQTLALEWGPKVRVNFISAGMIDTDQGHYGDAESVARVEATVPLGRLGTPADVAEAVVFLASPGAAFVTGSNLVVDGGGEA